MEFHEACQLFPQMSTDEFERLAEDIAHHGLIEPIWTHQGQIVDGRNRLRACQQSGAEPRFREWEGRGSLVEFILSVNLHRRHLAESQRAAVAVLLGPSLDPDAGDRLERAAARLNVSRGLAYEAKAIRDRSPETFERIHSGELTVHAAKRAVQRAAARDLVKTMTLPAGRYRTIVADPPWPTEKIQRRICPGQVGFEYPTMTDEELRAFPLGDLAHDDCHLYLWTTHKHLSLALALADHWGFRYHCLMTWIKNVGFTPFSWMYSTEHVLFCRRGNLELKELGVRLDFTAKVREHSRKPEEFYQIVRRVSPAPRIDVFAREKRDGFDAWGNEVGRFADNHPVVPDTNLLPNAVA